MIGGSGSVVKSQEPSAFFDELHKDLPEPYEFVAEAGDVLMMHHPALHAGNDSHSANRKPRLRGENA